MNILPVARTSEIVVQELKGELLVYDLTTDKAFCLNRTAAVVYEACNGKTTFAELTDRHKLVGDIIYLALDELKKHNLLVNGNTYVSPYTGMNRRAVIKRIGLASLIALPVISGVIAPQAAQAASVSNTCTPVGGCRAAGSIVCPPDCTATINLISYQTSDGTCGGLTSTETLDCLPVQGLPAGVDYQRVA